MPYTPEQLAALPTHCACPLCPARFGAWCDCGLYWYDGDRRPHCGRHDAADRPIAGDPVRYAHPSPRAALKRALRQASSLDATAGRVPRAAQQEDSHDPSFFE